MPLSFKSADEYQWSLKKIAVIGPGIVGMPMAAMLAHARIEEGSDTPAKVVVVQRNSRDLGLEGGGHQRRPVARSAVSSPTSTTSFARR